VQCNNTASVAILIQSDADVAAVEGVFDSTDDDAILLRQHTHVHLVYLSDRLRKHPLYARHGIQAVYPINVRTATLCDVVACCLCFPFLFLWKSKKKFKKNVLSATSFVTPVRVV
jgi:hypothetical protein